MRRSCATEHSSRWLRRELRGIPFFPSSATIKSESDFHGIHPCYKADRPRIPGANRRIVADTGQKLNIVKVSVAGLRVEA
jgi:hypothetical protein